MNNMEKYKIERENLYNELGEINNRIIQKGLNVHRNQDSELVNRYWEIHREITALM